MSDNKRSLNLFNLACGDKPFELVTDRKPQQGGIFGFGAKDYEAFYGALKRFEETKHPACLGKHIHELQKNW